MENFSPRKVCLDFKQIAIASSILFGPVIFLCHDFEIWYVVMCICAHKLLQKTNRKGFNLILKLLNLVYVFLFLFFSGGGGGGPWYNKPAINICSLKC